MRMPFDISGDSNNDACHSMNAQWKRNFWPILGVVILSVFWGRLPQHGLQATYYDHPNFQGNPVISKIERQADLSTLLYGRFFLPGEEFLRKTNISILWEGWLRIDHEGAYRFSVASDSFASLNINDVEIVHVDEPVDLAINKASGTATLSRGLHRIEVRYAQHDGTARKLALWRQQTGASFDAFFKKTFASYALSVQWTVPGVRETSIPPEYLSPAPLSPDARFIIRHRPLFIMIYVFAWSVFDWTMLGTSRNAYLKHVRRVTSRRIYEALLFLAWCIPSGIIFLGWRGIAFAAFLYLSGRPISILLKKQCFLLERIVLSIAISVVLFAFTLSWLLHVMPFSSAALAAMCVYAFISVMISFWNWTQRKTDADDIGSKMVYGMLLAFNLFVCLVSANLPYGSEQAICGDALMRIINQDYSYWGHKYPSILYDALIYSSLPPSTIPTSAETAHVSPYALSRHYALAVTLSAIQLYLMTIISMLSLFVLNRLAVVIAAFTYYFFSASLGTYTFFRLFMPLGQLSNNYALVQFPNLFFALFLPIYGLWRHARPAIIIGFLCLAFLPASHPGYFIIVIGAIALFPAIAYLYRHDRFHEPSETKEWQYCYRLYILCGVAAAAIIMIHGSFLREFLLTALHIPRHSSSPLLWADIFLAQPKWWITFWNFSSAYQTPVNLLPLWHPNNLSACPPWIFLAMLLLPYLGVYHKALAFITGSIYLMCFLYLWRGLPLNALPNLSDVYQPFDVLFHVSFVIASYSLLELVFCKKNIAVVYRVFVGILLFLIYMTTFINTFFATVYPGVFGGHSYIVSLFQNNPMATMQNSWHLYLRAMQQLW